jgi:membrane-bound metal-dependent hydrolase YbcI (DUF457 family)
VPAAVAVSLFLLLFMGFFGHNLFRFTWLWYGGFLLVAVHCLKQRVAAADEEAVAVWSGTVAVDPDETEAEPIPAGWTWDDGHG